MSSSDDIELGEVNNEIHGEISDVPDAEPLMNGRQIDDIAVKLRNNWQKTPPPDPIYDVYNRGNIKYFQVLVERLILYESEDHRKSAVSHLRREILLSDSEALDVEDEGGISTYDVQESGAFNEEEKVEYKQPMCLFERILWIFIRMQFKDKQPTDVVEIMLVKSNIDYEVYKNKRVLSLLREYDQLEPNSVKYLQWQIFSGKAEYYVTSSESSAEKTSFMESLENAISDQDLLDEVFEAVFPSGSLNLLKHLLTKIREKEIILKCPVLVNAVYWSIYVKDENLPKFKACFDYALKSEKHTLADTESTYGDTPLHIANEFREHYMTREILKNYPPIAVKNKKGKFPISNLPKEDFKSFLDSLITDIPTIFLKNLDVWKIIKGIYIDEYNLENVIFVNYNTFCDKNEFHDLELIREIKDSKELWELVDHPVISILLELHWKQLRGSIIIDQYLTLCVTVSIFFLSFCVNHFLSLPEWLESKYFDITISVVSFIAIMLELFNNHIVFLKLFKIFIKTIKKLWTITVNLVLKVIQFVKRKNLNINESKPDEIDTTNDYEDNESAIFQTDKKENQPRFYGTIFSFVLTLPLLSLLFLFGFWGCTDDFEHCKKIFGIGIIIFSLNVSLFIGYFFRSIAINLILLFYVAFTGIKFILSTFLILLGFALSLITLIKDYGLPENDDAELKDVKESNKTEEAISKISLVGLGIFKTIVMSTGEYEAGVIKFSYFTSYLVFVCFVFTIPIVFINLLNALAIEDVQTIKKEAMIWYRKVQIMFLYEFKILHKSIFNCCLKENQKIFPDIIGEKAFIGIRTTKKEILQMNDVDDHIKIGYLPLDVIENAEKELNHKKNT